MTVSAAPRGMRYSVPTRDGTAFVHPALESLPATIAHNRSLHVSLDDRLDGMTTAGLRDLARRELVEAAASYTGEYRDVSLPSDPHAPLILSGHQPELVHSGVWFKHFVLHEAAASVRGVGVHVLIDHDTAKRTSILVPTGSIDDPRLASIEYDESTPDVPYEQREIRNRESFRSFGTRVAEAVRELVPDPLVRTYWPRVLSYEHRPLGESLAIGRHLLEADYGLQTLEVPLSRICSGVAFHWFVSLLIGDVERMHAAYNSALASHRRLRGMRSPRHPVPDLEYGDGRWEVPLWVWHRERSRRERCYVRRRGEEVLIGNGRDLEFAIRQPAGSAHTESVSDLLQWSREGMCLRPRALTTTLFARWLVGDIFIHGIGGAVYDEVTDEFSRRWWNSPAPEFMVATATFRLPIASQAVDESDLRRLDEQLRQLEYHPELFIDQPVPAAQRWIEQKRYWLGQELPKSQRKTRHDRITEANERLQEWVQPLRFRLASERARLAGEIRRQQILMSREFAFCVFPADLPARLGQLARDTL